jgi:hypothetical protein
LISAVVFRHFYQIDDQRGSLPALGLVNAPVSAEPLGIGDGEPLRAENAAAPQYGEEYRGTPNNLMRTRLFYVQLLVELIAAEACHS